MQPEQEIVEKLKALLDQMDPNDIYRSIFDHEKNLIVQGAFPVQQRLVDDYCRVDFKDKTVVDLGCNFGFFSFQAARLGAKHVTGLDYLPEIVKGASLLSSLYGYDNVVFRRFDIEEPETDPGKYDIAMLVDFFGKSNIRKQKIRPLLSFLQTLSDKELLLAFRPINRIEKDLKLSLDTFSKLYPQKYVTDGSFVLEAYVKDILFDQWEMSPVSNWNGSFSKDK
jgi:predicted RNA methylase